MAGFSTFATVASMAMTVGTTVMKMQAQSRQADATAASLRYQAAVARNNQTIANFQAQDALERGAEREKLKRLDTAKRLGTARAAGAARGVVVDEDSFGTITEDIAEFGELDALNEAANAEREAFQLRARAQNFAADSTLLETNASNQIAAGRMAMFSTLLGGATTFGGQFAKGYQSGAFG